MGTQSTSGNLIKGACASVLLLCASTALAQNKPTKGQTPPQSASAKPGAASQGGDKVDITDLENKYWAPKDTDFSVVQNRTFSKEKKFSVTPQIGRPINDTHSEGTVYGLSANYFWSERMGVQFTWLNADLKNNEATNDLATYGSGVQPDHGKFKRYMGVGYNIVPFYAKMSFWGKKIIYFDMAFTPMVGMTQYEQIKEHGNSDKSALTYGLDISQLFFFSRWLAVRVDLKNQWHVEEVVKYRNTGAAREGDKVSNKSIQDTMFLVGAMFYF